MGGTLESVLILLASAVIVVVIFRSLHLPPLLGYLLVGVAVGPFALAWIADTSEGRHLGEFGVVFLMFSIGLEFSLPKLFQLRRAVFGLGLVQVLLTLAGVLAVAAIVGAPWQAGLALGARSPCLPPRSCCAFSTSACSWIRPTGATSSESCCSRIWP